MTRRNIMKRRQQCHNQQNMGLWCLSVLLVLLLLTMLGPALPFLVPRQPQRQHRASSRLGMAVQETAAGNSHHQVILSEVERLQQEAQKIRQQAQEMESNLLQDKITALQKKLSDPKYMEKQTLSQQQDLQEQLLRLQAKLNGEEQSVVAAADTTAPSFFSEKDNQLALSSSSTESASTTRTVTASSLEPPSATLKSSSSSKNNNKEKNPHIPPMAGFDSDDLALYIPIANDINKMTAGENATLQERLQLFQTAPELQQHFQDKITRLITGPLEELQRLEDVKAQYLESNSSVERKNLKKQIDKLEASLKSGGGSNSNNIADLAGGGAIEISISEVSGSSSSYGNRDKIKIIGSQEDGMLLPPLSEKELEERYQTISALPDILIAIYKQRTSVDSGYDDLDGEEDDVDTTNESDENILKMAIQLDYYSSQLQLLEQVRNMEPFGDKEEKEFIEAFESLPRAVQQCFARQMGMEQDQAKECTAKGVLEAIRDSDSPFQTMVQIIDTSDAIANEDPPEYNDIEFVDRSRYLEEFFPAVARMDGAHPKQEDVELFVTDCLAKSKAFMVTSKPERVIGGYYVRGTNQLSDDDGNKGPTASERMVEDIAQRLQEHSTLNAKLDFFYILDPSPPSDEEMEMGEGLTPVLLVTSKDSKTLDDDNRMYDFASPLTKALVTGTGLASAFTFSVGCCVLNPTISDRLFKMADAVTASGDAAVIDLQWFWDLCLPLYASVLGILFVHEAAHRIVAAQYKFDIGMPNVIPSITQGVAGSITAFKSPPPSNKALFDFSIAGPLAGLVASVAFLLIGLQMTQTASLDSALPVLPVDFVRSSSLGGGLVEFFLGKVALLPDQGPTAVIQLHPYAVAGFIGCLVNALALLPLGHTDGGRISLAMFGRRGAFVTKLFTTVILTLAGLFGLDENNILLAYVLYSLVWQRELETPVRNEVDEVDFSRGLLGISGALLVGLVLIPML